MFISQYSHSFDSKGRIIIPAKFREELGEEFYITKGIDTCLLIYTKAQWDAKMEKMLQLPTSNDSIRSYIRKFTSSAVICQPDKNGRISIPQNLRDYAKLEKDVVSVGVISNIEIWSSTIFAERENENVVLDSEAKAKLNELGL